MAGTKDAAFEADAKVAAGIDLDGNQHPLSTTTDGVLEVEVTGTASPLDVIVDNVVPVSQSGPWTVTLATEPTIDIGEVSIKPSPTGLNLFATADASYGIETTILSYTNTAISFITQLIGWGQYDGEFLIRINGTIVGGGRTSAADRTLNLNYMSSGIPTTHGDTIIVTILEYGPGTQNFRCNLLGQ